MTTRRRQGGKVVQLGSGSVQGPSFSALRAADSAAGPENDVRAAERPNLAPQTLVLVGFPLPEVARALSPNGRAHWTTKRTARLEAASAVKIEATCSRLRPVAGPVRLLFRYVFPDRRTRDVDNLTTGVTKVAIDALVRGRWLEADDSEHVLEVRAEAVYERGRRCLEIIIAPAAPGGTGDG